MTHLALLQKGIESWNLWRSRHPNTACDLENQDLSHGYFFEGNFSGANLRNANLQRACFVGANFQDADLSGADFRGAYLADANFYGANLSHANLSNTDLDRADMRDATLLGTQMADVDLRHTRLPNATDSQYSQQVMALLAQSSSSAVKLEAHSEELYAKEPQRTVCVEERRLPALWTGGAVKLFRRSTPDAIADRQQRIRLSAIPVHKKAGSSAAIPSGSALSRSSSNYSQSTSRRWRRRRANQSLPYRLRRMLSRRVIWAPVVLSVAGLLAASRWSTVTDKTAANFDSDSSVSRSRDHL